MRLAATAVLAMLAWAVVAVMAIAAELPPDAAAETRRLLATPVDVGPETISLDQLFADIQRQAPGLKIEMDTELTSAGYDFKVGHIYFAARRIPAAEALTLALQDHFAWEVRPGGVMIYSMTDRWKELSVVRYPMARLLAPRLPAGRRYYAYEAWSEPQEYMAIIQRIVSSMTSPQVAAWTDEGGQAQLEWAGSSMLVSQTREGHRRIAELLLGLSRALGLEYDGPMPERRPENPAIEEVRRLLARRIDLDFEWTSIKNALEYIRQLCPGLNLVVDPRLAPAGMESEDRRNLCMKFKGVTIEEALSHCLRPSFAWEVRPGYILITVPRHLPHELPVTIYPVRDLAQMHEEDGMAWGLPELIAIIQRTVNAQSDEKVAAWSDEGGPAPIEYMCGMLIVSQTRRGHAEVDRLLRLVRSAEAFARQQSSRPRAAIPCFAFPEDPQLAATYDALETRMDVDFKDKPVMEAIEAVTERAPRLNVVIEDAVPERITLKRQGATRKAILEELIGKKARCRAQRGYVVVEDEELAYPRLLLAAYPVGAVRRGSPSNLSGEALMGAVTSAVNHADDPNVATWSDEGGPASIESFAGVLLITQTPQAHRRISAALQELRFRGRAAGPVP